MKSWKKREGESVDGVGQTFPTDPYIVKQGTGPAGLQHSVSFSRERAKKERDSIQQNESQSVYITAKL